MSNLEPSNNLALLNFLRKELAIPVLPIIQKFANEAFQLPDVLCVLFYGSCMHRTASELSEMLLDFYLLTDDRKIGPSAALQWAGRLLPPNVFYLEQMIDGQPIRAKYAVMSLSAFEERAAGKRVDSSIWARFCQPARLVWVADEAIEKRVVKAVAGAALTFVKKAALPFAPADDPAKLWEAGFRMTYGAELRSERANRAREIVMRDRSRYEELTRLLLPLLEPGALNEDTAIQAWKRRRMINKLLNMLRLMKAAFTFRGGLSYILWKIERHSGIRYEPSQWQTRHPLLAAPYLAWKLYRKGAFR